MNRPRLHLLALAWLLVSLLLAAAAPLQSGSTVVWMRWDGPLSAPWDSHLERALHIAEERNATALIIELNTPGGSVGLMNTLVQRMRSSDIPVVVYVSPAGAMAGSAGTVLTLAAYVAAMAPETAIGAASPVGGQGEEIGETMQAKVKEMLRATVRSLAEGRGERAVQLAEDTIEKATAVSVNEALDAGLVDLRARNQQDLLEQLDGRSVRVQDKEVILHTADVVLVEVPATMIEEVLMVLASPDLVFLLLAIGVQAILIELSTPGGWVAGFVGVICVALAVYGMGALPVNWFGAVFLVVAFVLFILDIKAPTHGALTVAGVVSFIAGALILFNSPNVPSFQRVSIPLVVGTGIAIGGIFLVILTFAIRAQSAPLRVLSTANLPGKVGVAKTDVGEEGTVQLGGELWSARAVRGNAPIRKGETVEVVEMEGMILHVRSSGQE